ncbi:MAG: ubiquinol-cytochrome C chaperone family protein, partial [Hyphomicrobium sp.]
MSRGRAAAVIPVVHTSCPDAAQPATFRVDAATMLNWLRTCFSGRRKAGELYGAVVAAARQPAFFAAWRVPDTPEGRFEILVLALFLFLERLKVTRPDGSALARDVIEA